MSSWREPWGSAVAAPLHLMAGPARTAGRPVYTETRP